MPYHKDPFQDRWWYSDRSENGSTTSAAITSSTGSMKVGCAASRRLWTERCCSTIASPPGSRDITFNWATTSAHDRGYNQGSWPRHWRRWRGPVSSSAMAPRATSRPCCAWNPESRSDMTTLDFTEVEKHIWLLVSSTPPFVS